MSLESALDEERREVMALLEGRPAPRTTPPTRPTDRKESPKSGPNSPVRSMLDVGAPPRHKPGRSMLDIGDEAAGGRPGKSMLDIGDDRPRKPRPRHASTGRVAGTGIQIRTPGLSPGRAPRPLRPPPTSSPFNPEQDYKFEMLPSIDKHALPKRASQSGKKPSPNNAKDHARQNSLTSSLIGGTNKSNSPSSRLPPGRAQSPGSTTSSQAMNDPKKWVTNSGKVVELDTAYRKLNDIAFANSGGILTTLPSRKSSDGSKSEGAEGGVRLEKDYYDDDDEDAIETSEDDSDASSGAEGWGAEKRRGRKRTRKPMILAPGDEAKADVESGREPKSLLAAAEDERKEVSSNKKVRSLLEPELTYTGPDGEKMTTKDRKKGVHPNTNFDQGGSGISTPMDSDREEEISELTKAQRMAMHVSPIHSTPEAHRCVRQIVRGEYMNFQQEAEQGLRRQRVYLVSTDLSEEAAYALEWTIGTVLRDGDTLLAVYAVDEEVGTGADAHSGHIVTAAEEANSLVRTLSNNPISGSATPRSNAESEKPPDLAGLGRAERERWIATMDISDRCVKLLRKTKLQVRVVVEVFHCKSPKHMITEVIDYLEPTLVILGSRGRSALKGVLLGSFSNYLVTKSSVPVMVARKRLRKHSKYKRTNLRFSNVLSSPSNRRLESAKID